MKAQTVHMTDKMLRDAVIAQLDFEPEVESCGNRRGRGGWRSDAFRIRG